MGIHFNITLGSISMINERNIKDIFIKGQTDVDSLFGADVQKGKVQLPQRVPLHLLSDRGEVEQGGRIKQQ